MTPRYTLKLFNKFTYSNNVHRLNKYNNIVTGYSARSFSSSKNEKGSNKNNNNIKENNIEPQQIKQTESIRNDDEISQWKGFERDKTKKPDKIQLAYGELGDKFFVINKPSGYPIQSNLNESMESILLDQLKEERDKLLKQVETNPNLYKTDPRARKKLVNLNAVFNEQTPRLYFPQRLDKWTQGLMIVSLTGSLQAILSDSMKTWVKKYRLMVDLPKCFNDYHNNSNNRNSIHQCCIVSPHIKGDRLLNFSKPKLLTTEGIIKSFLGPKKSPVLGFNSSCNNSTSNNTKGCEYCKENNYGELDKHPFVPIEILHSSSKAQGKNKYQARNAQTKFELVQLLKDQGKAIFQVELLTGRTHQIRVHFSESGLPIIGDFYYNPFFIKDIQDDKDISNIKGLCLQSYYLEFLNPSDQTRVKVEIEKPNDWL